MTVEVADRKAMTAAQLTEELTQVWAKVKEYRFTSEVIIEDYPIGGRNRGLCRITIEWKKGKWRPVSQTTNKHGIWCKPKCGVYRPGFGAVCSPPEGYSGWFYADDHSIGVQHVANKGYVLSECPWYFVRRQDQSYDLVTSDMGGREVGRETYHEKADPPEVIAAYDAWQKQRRAIRDNIIHQWPITAPGL